MSSNRDYREFLTKVKLSTRIQSIGPTHFLRSGVSDPHKIYTHWSGCLLVCIDMHPQVHPEFFEALYLFLPLGKL